MKLFWIGRSGLGPHMKRIMSGGFAGVVLDGKDPRRLIAEERSWKRLTRAAQSAKMHDEAGWAELAARRLHEVRPNWRTRLTLAWILASGKRPEEGGRVLSEVPAERDNHPMFRETSAMLLARRGMFDEAVAALEDCPGAIAGVRPARAAITAAYAMMNLGDLSQAAAFLDRLRALYPDNLRLRAVELMVKLALGDFDGARDLASVSEDALAAAPRIERRAMVEAQVAMMSHLGRVHDQFDICERMLERDPGNWPLYSHLSDVAKPTGQEDRYQDLIDAIPPDLAATPDAVSLMCRRAIDRSDLERANELLGKLRVMSPGHFLNASLFMAINHQSREEVEAAYQACVDSGINLLGATISIGLYLYYFRGSAENSNRALGHFRHGGILDSLNTTVWQVYLRLLIASEKDDEARRQYRQLPPGLRQSAKLRPMSIYFDAMEGRHDQARAGWAEHIRTSRHLCVNAKSSYPETVRLRYVPTPDAILAYTVVFNGSIYLDWYLRHYRALGVDHFFITDNGSTDGTFERLLEEPDVSVFRNTGSFRASQFGVMWTNHLMQKFGVGHWCFHVDIDEGFVFPGQEEGRTLRDLTGYLDSRGYGAVRCFSLDMYPERLDVGGPDPFAVNCHYDVDYTMMRSDIPPYFICQGGLRQRMTDLALSLQKMPLVRVAPDTRYIECNHSATHLPLADLSTVLLHYKFVGDMRARLDEAVGRSEHFAGAMAYRRMRSAAGAGQWSGSLLSGFSRIYKGPRDLVDNGLMQSSPGWDEFAARRADRTG